MEFHNEALRRMKLCLVGDGPVGKTSIVRRFAGDTFDVQQEYTVGVSFMPRSVNIDGEMIEYQIWDIAGQETVPYDDGKSYADEVNAIFMETSAKTGENIEEVFFEIGKYYILLKLKFKRMFQAIIVETANKEPRFFLSSLDTFLHNKLAVSVPA